jgi:hypothetical protein
MGQSGEVKHVVMRRLQFDGYPTERVPWLA